ncbi:hypothetical protein FFLO_05538 [Filobasidium floriforme]|uniref:Protein PBN1 n=1 Tax=Filobasidium floriforme TaxID=5210 RepID=A0A8K0JGT8_9TREE|nr:hypothetical protein FFLO_05538 [Filobasidium floriforme]
MSLTNIATGFIRPHSIHPKIQVDVSGSRSKGCDLHLFVRTNDKIFFDPYELEDLWQPTGSTIGRPNEVVSWNLSPVSPDLERPVKYGFRSSNETDESAVENKLHVQLAWPSSDQLQHVIPAHARYQQPKESGYDEVRISTVDSSQTGLGADVDVRAVWSCSEESETPGSLIDRNVLDPDIRRHLSGSYLYNIDPTGHSANESTSASILLPAAIPSHQALVESITFCVVLGCFVWIMKVLFDVARQKSTTKPSERSKIKVD